MWYSSLVILGFYGWSLAPSVMAETAMELESDGNITEMRAHALEIFKFDLSHTGAPLAIVFVILGLALVRPLILKVHMIPPSVILLLFGVLFSLVVQVFPETVPNLFHFNPEIFFAVYLPFIIADAGWFLPTKTFFRNIGQICLYAVVGTIMCSALTLGFLLIFKDYYTISSVSTLSLTVFCVVISAVDPVAVISVFEEVQVNERLNILVFGESLLNDGVVIVLYNSLQRMLIYGEGSLGFSAYWQVIVAFTSVVGFGILFGVLFGIVGVALQRLVVTHQAIMPTINLTFPYIAYLIADSFHFSGLVALLTCCMIMKNYLKGNNCMEMQYTAEFVFKNMGSYSESFIFILLGFATGKIFSQNLDYVFIAATFAGITLIRFIVIFSLTGITNSLVRFREERIAFRDQFIMAFGGLRGAVCYGLIASVDPRLMPEKPIFVNTTVCIIVLTTALQGCSIRHLVNWMNVKTKSHRDGRPSSVQHAVLISAKHINNFVEDLTLNYQENIIFRWVRCLDGKIRCWLCYYKKPKGLALLEEQVEEETFYRKGCSFAGLPTDHSLANMHLPTSKSELFAQGYHAEDLMPPSGPKPSVPRLSLPPTSPIPRNESISRILPAIYENEFMDRESLKNKRQSIYSRHLLGYQAPQDPSTSRPDRPDEEDEDDTAVQMTFPYAKDFSQRMLAQQARSLSKSVKDKGHVRFVSPHRSNTTKHDHHYKTYHASSSGSHPRPSVPPRFTITDEENSPSPPNASKAGRARSERKVTSGNKTFVVGGEEIDLLPIHEDEDQP